MKVSISWLKELVEINDDVIELAEKLSMTGFEVESVENLADQANGVVIGFVETVSPHPNAEKLKVTSVDVGLNKKLNIVCGASNIRAGVHVLVAKVGAFLSSKSINIKQTNLRGVESEGMICSLEELGIESTNEGIQILEESNLPIPEIGSSAADYLALNDIILELAITANRPDGMSMVGIAREISTITNSELKLPKLDHSSKFDEFTLSIVNNESFGKDTIYTLSFLNNINNKIPTNSSLINKLRSLKQSSINPVVDITNYLMIEQGQPLHAFDADLLENLIGDKVKPNDFGIRNGRKDELFEALDNKKYNLNSNISVITCKDIPICIAGVIGGINSCVTVNTTRVWLEAAVFSPTSVRKSSREIGLRTDASSRYEKGISPNMTIAVSSRASELISKELNGNLISSYIHSGFKENKLSIYLRMKKINQILGKVKKIPLNGCDDISDEKLNHPRNINKEEVEFILSKLGCNMNPISDDWEVEIPPHRSSDLTREIDLIEEIARLIGYDNFDTNMPEPLEPGLLIPSQLQERRIRNSFTNSGFQEVVTSSLVGPENSQDNTIVIKNPLLSETSRLRTNAWDEHLKILKRNISFGAEACWIFEIVKIYEYKKGEYHEQNLLCGALTGIKRFSRWSVSNKSDSLQYFEARGQLKQALDILGIEIIDKPNNKFKLMHPGRTSELYVEGKGIGMFGQIHPSLKDKYGLKNESYIFRLDYESIINASTRKNNWMRIYKDFPTVPAMERDIALIHAKAITSSEIINIIRKAGRPYLENVELIDRYESSSIDNEYISQAFRIRYRDNKKTLSEKDINPIHEKVRKELKNKLKADLRS